MTATRPNRRRRQPVAIEPSQNGHARPDIVPAEPTPVIAPISPVDAKIEQTAETIIKECSKVRVFRSWLSTSTRIADDVLEDMIDAPKKVKAALTVSKRTIKSNHDAWKAASQAYAAVEHYVNGMTIPLIALRGGGGEETTVRKDGGVRVIQKKDMAEFDAHMHYLQGVLKSAVDQLQAAWPQIIADQKPRLDALNEKLFNASDYPEDITQLITVGWGYEPIGLDADWKTLCPEIYEREAASAKKKCEAVVENAAAEFAKTFVEVMSQAARSFGCRTRLNPTAGGQHMRCKVGDQEILCDLTDAEVIETKAHADDAEIPEGLILVKVRLKKVGKGQPADVWLAEPNDRQAWNARFRPYETAEKRIIHTSTVDHLKDQLETFLRVGDLLGPYKEAIAGSVAKVREMLTKGAADLNTTKIADELRKGTFFRNELKTSLENVAGAVQTAMRDTVVRRRTIKASLIGEM